MSIAQLFIAGVIPGILLALLFMGYIIVWALLNPDKMPPADAELPFMDKLRASGSLIPVVLLIAAVLGSIYAGIATATEAAAAGRGRLAAAVGRRRARSTGRPSATRCSVRPACTA